MFTVIKLQSQICVGISTATVITKQGKQNAAMWLMKPNFSQNITFIFIMLIFSTAKLYTKQVSSIVAGYITVYLQKIEVEKIKIKVLICTILEHLPLLYPSNISPANICWSSRHVLKTSSSRLQRNNFTSSKTF